MIKSVSGGNAITKNLIRSKKICLFLSAIFASIIDLALVIVFASSGLIAANQIIMAFPLVLILLDVLLLFAVVKSNLRYAYSLIMPLIYAIISVVLAFLTIIIIGASGSVFANKSEFAFIIVRAVISLIVLLTALLGSRIKKGASLISFVLFIVLALCSLTYGASVFSNGFFGQGGLDVRPIVYKYDAANDVYVASFALSGKVDKAFIPKEFNGKPVVKIDNALLCDNGLNTIEFEKGTQVTFNNLMADSLKKEILIDCSQFDAVKTEVANTVKNSGYDVDYVNFYNSIQPKNVSGEYVTFSYDKESFLLIDGKPIHAWFGERGDEFHLSDFEDDFAYIKHIDTSNESALFESYKNNGYVLNKPEIEGQKINESIKRVWLKFEKIYQVKIGDCNDEKYSVPKEYKNPYDTGYRYVVKSTAENLVKEGVLPERVGFNLGWKYSSLSSQGKLDFDSVVSVLDLDGITLHPEWEMQRPNIDKLNMNKDNIVYGDQAEFSMEKSPTHPIADATFTYEWKKGGQTIEGENGSTFIISKAKPSDSGNYTLTITVHTDSSSLSASREIVKELSVSKRELSVTWNVPTGEDLVYSGQEKVWSASVSNLATGDVFAFGSADYFVNGKNGTIKNAGEYTLSLSVPEKWTDYYTLNESLKKLEITKKEIDVQWDNLTKTYNGYMQSPTVTAYGVDGQPVSVVSTGAKNYGTHDVYADISDENYKISDATIKRQLNITPAQVDAQWLNLSLTYNGYMQRPSVNFVGLGGDGIINAVSVTGGKDAGEYTVTATFDNDNYDVNNLEMDFIISPAVVYVQWYNLTKTYNGYEQTPSAYASGLGSDGTINAVSVTGGKDAGEYTATATFNNENYNFTNTSETFTISQAKANVEWTDLSFEYDGAAHKPTATVTGVGNDGALNFTYKTPDYTDVGTYTAEIILNGETNYYLTSDSGLTNANAKISFTINKKQINVVWANLAFDYDGAAHKPTATANGVNGQPLTILISGEQVDVGTHKATATIADDNYQIVNATIDFVINQVVTQQPEQE